MLLQLFILSTVVYTTKSLDLNHLYLTEELVNTPIYEKCRPTRRMIDFSAKIPHSILQGNLIEFGNYDGCIALEEKKNNTDKIKLGKHCLVKVVVPLGQSILPNLFEVEQEDFNITAPNQRVLVQIMFEDPSPGIILGWCLPHECPIRELTGAINKILKKISEDFKVVPLGGGICQTKEDLVITYTTNDILIIIFFGITLLLIIFSTIYDMYIGHYKKEPIHIILLAFSIKSNGQKLLAVSNHPDQLSCLNGIRFISMMWVIYAHKFQTFSMGPVINMIDTKDWVNNPIKQYILNAGVSVDSFFVLSGILVSYIFCNAMEKGVKFNIFQYYIHRYLRLTPVLAVLIWLHSTVLTYLASGPLHMTSSALKNFCDDYWWATLLYIQNYYNPKELCIGQTWYLSVDMQLYILSPLLLIPLWKWPKQTIAACSVLVLAAIAIPFTISYLEEFKSIVTTGHGNNFMDMLYLPTHTRFGPWLIGFILGYYLFTLKKNKHEPINLSPLQVILGWIVGLGLLFSTLFSGYVLQDEDDVLGNAFYNSCHRQGWALGISWVVFACTQGYGGPINDFLSWSVFQVLGRFTYTMYLTHLSIMYLFIASSRTSVYFNDYYIMYIYWGDFMLTLAVSICFTLAYESPMMTIEKVLFRKHTKKKQENVRNVIEGGNRNEGCVKEDQ